LCHTLWSTAINQINGMMKKATTMNVVPEAESYGMKALVHIRPFGTLYKRRHVVHVIVL
jgi:hypothetical protein